MFDVDVSRASGSITKENYVKLTAVADIEAYSSLYGLQRDYDEIKGCIPDPLILGVHFQEVLDVREGTHELIKPTSDLPSNCSCS